MLSNNHPLSSNHVLNQNHDRFSCRQILPRGTTEKYRQVFSWPPGVDSQHCHPHPPLRGLGCPCWVWRKISIQPLQYLQSISIVSSASLTNYSNPGSGDEPALRLVIAPAKHWKYRSPSDLTATPESRKAQTWTKIPSCSGFGKLCAIQLQQAPGAPCQAAPASLGSTAHGSTTLLAHHGCSESPGGWKWSPCFKRLQNMLSLIKQLKIKPSSQMSGARAVNLQDIRRKCFMGFPSFLSSLLFFWLEAPGFL